VSLASYWFFLRPPRYAWLFKGAYATYQGVTAQSLLSLNATIHVEVLNYNDNQAELLFYFKVVTRMGTPVTESQNTTWVDLDGMQSLFVSGSPQQTSEDYVYVEGVGSMYCTIYEYSSQGNSLTVYIDEELGWPVKFRISAESSDMFGSFNIDINLAATNIPSLK
jgi:hypothetical protein